MTIFHSVRVWKTLELRMLIFIIEYILLLRLKMSYQRYTTTEKALSKLKKKEGRGGGGGCRELQHIIAKAHICDKNHNTSITAISEANHARTQRS